VIGLNAEYGNQQYNEEDAISQVYYSMFRFSEALDVSYLIGLHSNATIQSTQQESVEGVNKGIKLWKEQPY
jgi:uncharacterized protein (UPF0332 family)